MIPSGYPLAHGLKNEVFHLKNIDFELDIHTYSELTLRSSFEFQQVDYYIQAGCHRRAILEQRKSIFKI